MAKRKIYRFTGKEGTFLPEELMKKWMQKHLDHHETRGHFYGKEFLTKILSQPGCMGIRFYHAINDEGEKTLVVVGADAKGASMWASTHGAKSKGKLRDDPPGSGDKGKPCPPYC